MNQNRAVFLDRDGVINVDLDYAHLPEEIRFVDGIFDLGRFLVQNGFLLFIITNQSGIARGYYTEREFWKLMRWMCSIFEKEKAPIRKVFFCPYHPKKGMGKYKHDSEFRKPNPGMILKAEKRFDLDLSRSILIGDQESDIEAGERAGVGLFCLLFNQNKTYSRTTPEDRFESLDEIHSYLKRKLEIDL